jgi:hypothetical protein
MASFDKCKYKTLSAKAEIIKKFDRGEILLIWLKNMVLVVLQYTISGKIEGRNDRQTLNIELMDKYSQYTFMYVK